VAEIGPLLWRLAELRSRLLETQRYVLPGTLRDVADELDHGRPQRLMLITLHGPNGRATSPSTIRHSYSAAQKVERDEVAAERSATRRATSTTACLPQRPRLVPVITSYRQNSVASG
jgi:hypothetical protein